MPVTDSIVQGISSQFGSRRDAEYLFSPDPPLGGKKRNITARGAEFMAQCLEDIEWRVAWKGFRVRERFERP